MGYSRVVSQYPFIVIVAVIVFSTACLIVSFIAGTLPDFADPKAGFETCGTNISGRYTQWRHLVDSSSIGHHSDLSVRPHFDVVHQGVSEKMPNVVQYNVTTDMNETDYSEERVEPKGFFCDSPRAEYARIVFKSRTTHSLFDYKHILSMCSLENDIVHIAPSYDNSCITQRSKCCRSWSLGNYIALLSSKDNCKQITETDVKKIGTLLHHCAIYYANSTLHETCLDVEDNDADKCLDVPKDCKEYNAIAHIFKYIVDNEFISTLSSGSPFLKYSMTFLPLAASIGMVDVYDDMVKHKPWQDKQTEIVAMDFGIKFTLFDKFLQGDTVWLCISMATIFILLWVYTSSFCITCMTVIVMALSLAIAYFIYTFIFKIDFFPFMNLLASVVIIGIGADDICIYTKAWSLAKSEKKDKTLEKIVSTTMKHAALSMFVTSFTTAAAFYSSYISDITAIKCFSLYTGTAIVVNFLLMVTWIPAVVVIHNKCTINLCQCYYGAEFYQSKDNVWKYIFEVPFKIAYSLGDCSRIFFEKLLPCFVIKLRFVWLIVLGIISAIGVVLIFYEPRLKLPSSSTLQVFSADHPFEVYDLEIRKKFDFEREHFPNLPLTFVWGAVPTDNRDRLNPASKGSLELDSSFDVGRPKSQEWLLNFCKALRKFEYFKETFKFQFTNCFIEHFRKFMQSPCSGEIEKPCCGHTKFPYSKVVFEQCIRVWMPSVAESRFYHFYSEVPGLRFTNVGKPRIAALIVEFQSNLQFSFSHQKIDAFYKKVEEFMSSQLSSAPPGMRSGWFISELQFYDLQDRLLHGTPFAMSVAVAISAAVLFFTTLNVLISLYAVITIVFTLCTTVGILVLLGWQLNILESVTMTVAVGLSIDFTLHYGMAYRLSPDLDRENRIVSSISRTGSSICMAAFTTFLAGALMLPSTVLAYRQLGTFLMVVMGTSWMYSTFFFQVLLRLGGPTGGFGQFHCPSSSCCSNSDHRHQRKDKTRYNVSESNCSTSSFSANPHSSASAESQEIELLPTEDSQNTKESKHMLNVETKHFVNNNARFDSLERKGLIVSFQRGFRSCPHSDQPCVDSHLDSEGTICDSKYSPSTNSHVVNLTGTNHIPSICVTKETDDIWILNQDML